MCALVPLASVVIGTATGNTGIITDIAKGVAAM
jgi:hypothetical protein